MAVTVDAAGMLQASWHAFTSNMAWLVEAASQQVANGTE